MTQAFSVQWGRYVCSMGHDVFSPVRHFDGCAQKFRVRVRTGIHRIGDLPDAENKNSFLDFGELSRTEGAQGGVFVPEGHLKIARRFIAGEKCRQISKSRRDD